MNEESAEDFVEHRLLPRLHELHHGKEEQMEMFNKCLQSLCQKMEMWTFDERISVAKLCKSTQLHEKKRQDGKKLPGIHCLAVAFDDAIFHEKKIKMCGLVPFQVAALVELGGAASKQAESNGGNKNICLFPITIFMSKTWTLLCEILGAKDDLKRLVSQDVQSGSFTQPMTQTSSQDTPAAESTGIEDAERPNLLQDVSVLSSIRNTDHQHRQKKANSLSQKQQVMTLWPEQRVNQTRTRHTREHQTNHIRVIIAQRDRNPSLQRRD